MKPVLLFRSVLGGALLLLSIAVQTPAQHPGAGTSLFDFLNIRYDARTVAMGGASVALPNDLYGVLSNPAAVGFIDNMQVLAGNRSEAAGIWAFPLAYAKPQQGLGVFAISAIALTTGNIEVTDRGNDGSMIRTGRNARSDDIAGGITWARKLNNFSSAGVTIKAIYNRLGTLGSGSESYSADGLALDGGLQYRFRNSRLVYGLATRNVGFLRSGYTSDEKSYDLPATVQIGMSYIPENLNNLRVALDIGKKRNDYLTFSPAAELEIIRGQLLVRAGLTRSWRDLNSYLLILRGEPVNDYQQTNMSAFSVGLGLITMVVDHRAKFDAALDFANNQGWVPSYVISLLTDL